MPQILPFTPSEPHYEFTTVLDNQPCRFEVHWNARDEAWFFDILTPQGVLVAAGIKVVLGIPLGRRVIHPLTAKGMFVAVDLSGKSREAGFNDMGRRVQVWYITAFEFASRILRQASDE